MTNPTLTLAYKRTALQQASTVGLVIALYDTLAGNLTRAAAAMESSDIERRCAELVHGFKVLQQLDVMLDMEHGGDAAVNIRRFYTNMRGQMLLAQFKLTSGPLLEQARLLLEVREAWQQVDSQADRVSTGSHCRALASASPSTGNYHPEFVESGNGRLPFSCSG